MTCGCLWHYIHPHSNCIFDYFLEELKKKSNQLICLLSPYQYMLLSKLIFVLQQWEYMLQVTFMFPYPFVTSQHEKEAARPNLNVKTATWANGFSKSMFYLLIGKMWAFPLVTFLDTSNFLLKDGLYCSWSWVFDSWMWTLCITALSALKEAGWDLQNCLWRST